MEKEIINKIISKMVNDLSPIQQKKLKNVLFEFQNEQNRYTNAIKKKNLVYSMDNCTRIMDFQKIN